MSLVFAPLATADELLSVKMLFSPSYDNVNPGQNLHFTVFRFDATDPISLSLSLLRVEDLDNDGLPETIEDVAFSKQVNCNLAGVRVHFVCQGFNNMWDITWKTASSLQISGRNYSLIGTLHSNVDPSLDDPHRMGFSVTFRNASVCILECQVSIADEIASTPVRFLLDKLTTTERRFTENASSFHNSTVQNISLHANRTIQNVSIYVDQNLTQLEGNLSVIDTDSLPKVINHTLSREKFFSDEVARKTNVFLKQNFTFNISGVGAGSALPNVGLDLILSIVLGLLVFPPVLTVSRRMRK